MESHLTCPECHETFSKNEVIGRACPSCNYLFPEPSFGEILAPPQTRSSEIVETFPEELTNRYEPKQRLPEGGMAVVFRAWDKLAEREVAVKILRSKANEEDQSHEVLARFRNEISALRRISDHRIPKIFVEGQLSSGQLYFDMEFVEGIQLDQVIGNRAPLPPEEVRRLATEICEALGAAHEQGVIHRDLKPSNIIVDGDGVPHILDFGISAIGGGTLITEKGSVIGTTRYLSPERLERRDSDHRADIYALGIILFELSTGHHPFEKYITKEELGAAIIRERPPRPSQLQQEIPAYLDDLVSRCIRKRKEGRPFSMSEVREALDRRKSLTGVTVAVRKIARNRRQRMMVAVALVALVVLTITNLVFFSNRLRAEHLPHAANFEYLAFSPFVEDTPAISPSGAQVVYSCVDQRGSDIWLQPIQGGNRINLTANSGAVDDQPAWSPDGQRIAFHSSRNGGGIFVMSATGGGAIRLVAGGQEPAWSPTGDQIAYLQKTQTSDFERVYVLDIATGVSHMISGGGPKFASHEHPSWSPGGRAILFAASSAIWVAEADGSQTHLLVEHPEANLSYPYWVSTGVLFFTSDALGVPDIWEAEIKGKGTKAGVPRPVTAFARVGALFVSADASQLAFSNPAEDEFLMRVDINTGTPSRVSPLAVKGKEFMPSVSPNGTHLAFISTRTGSQELWVRDLKTGAEQQLTNDRREKRWPTWSPDGQRIAYCSFSTGNGDIYTISWSGGLPARITSSDQYEGAPHWSPDGKAIVLNIVCNGNYEVATIPSSGGVPKVLTGEEGDEYDPTWSSTGQRIYYVKDRMLMTMLPDGSDKRSLFAGLLPRVSPDGEWLYFVRDGEIWKCPLGDGDLPQPEVMPQVMTSNLSTPLKYLDNSWKISASLNSVYFSMIRRLDSDIVVGRLSTKGR